MNLADDHFTLFGLPQRQALDRAALDARRRELQAQVHPDRFAAEGAAAQRIAMQWAVRVNEAWQCLKDPLARAAYLCELRGVPIDAERNTAMPASFLMRQMAWREALEDAADLAAVEQIDADVRAEERAGLARIEQLLDGPLPRCAP
jgi:molecular chaperone HscB